MLNGNSTETSVPSDFTSLQELLIFAWRCRFSAVEWGLLTQKYLRNSNNLFRKNSLSDSQPLEDLCEIMLRQILIGPKPSPLILSYFQHAVGTLLIHPIKFLSLFSKYASPEKSSQFYDLLKLAAIFVGSIQTEDSSSNLSQLNQSFTN
eukprot:Sdes_comp23273_c0_seq1m21555